MGEVIEIVRPESCCARCGIPMTSATAEDREDCFYCDKCLEAIVDGDGDTLRERDVNEPTPEMIERAARSLARDVWPLATLPERERWEERHWQDYVTAAKNALIAAHSPS